MFEVSENSVFSIPYSVFSTQHSMLLLRIQYIVLNTSMLSYIDRHIYIYIYIYICVSCFWFLFCLQRPQTVATVSRNSALSSGVRFLLARFGSRAGAGTRLCGAAPSYVLSFLRRGRYSMPSPYSTSPIMERIFASSCCTAVSRSAALLSSFSSSGSSKT